MTRSQSRPGLRLSDDEMGSDMVGVIFARTCAGYLTSSYDSSRLVVSPDRTLRIPSKH